MWNIDVSSKLGPEYVAVVEDVTRLVVIQVFVQGLLSLIDSEAGFFNPVFWLILCYLVLGSCVYHLIFKKLIAVI